MEKPFGSMKKPFGSNKKTFDFLEITFDFLEITLYLVNGQKFYKKYMFCFSYK